MSDSEPDARNGGQHERFLADVHRRRELREKEKREGDASFWGSVGMMGTVGWSVALPLAAGVVFGRWLDGRMDSGHVYMVFFMLVGLGVGIFITWRMIREKL